MKKPIPFGKYYLLDRISVGGMAEVFKAKAFGVEGFERLIAVKRILPSIAEDEEFITMFIDEAKIAVQLQHANIAQIFDLGKVGESYFIALEYVNGRDVRTIVDRVRKNKILVSIPMAAYVTMKVCEGLDYAHNKKDPVGRELNLVHRDVSPQNILISYDGEVKIIDFGIAKAAGKAGKTQAGILKGKFGYMSPEQVRGLPLDRRSDIFAVGICLWEMLTGERLFVGESDFSTLEKVRNVEITPPSAYNKDMPAELERIVLKTLSKEVEDRYQSAMDLHDDLQRWMYESGSFFGRKELAIFMADAFQEEIEREAIAMGEAAALLRSSIPPADDDNVSLPPPPPMPSKGHRAHTPPPRMSLPPPIPSSSKSGTAPIPVGPPAVSGGRGSLQMSSPRLPKRTMLGVPAPSLKPSAPPSQSNPTRSLATPVSRQSEIGRGGPPPTTGGEIQMDDWDEEEPPTNIYSKEAAREMAKASLAMKSTQEIPQPGGFNLSGPSMPLGAPRGGFNMPMPAADSLDSYPPPSRAARRTILPILLGLGLSVAILAVVVIFFVGKPKNSSTIELFVEPANLKALEVIVDGVDKLPSNMSPIRTTLAPGDHSFTIRHKGFKNKTVSVTLKSGEEVRRSVVLENTSTGFFVETDPPGAVVFVNERPYEEKTPVTIDDLEPGTYSVRLVKGENYQPKTMEVEVVSGEITQLPLKTMDLRVVEVIVKSQPSEAKAILIGDNKRQEIGKTPVSTELDTSKEYKIQFEKEGYDNDIKVVEFKPGEAKITIEAQLESKKSTTTAISGGRTGGSKPKQPSVAAPSGGGDGALSVQTRPWSKVFINNRFIKNTPLVNHALSPGTYTVTVENPEFSIKKNFKVKIQSGRTTTLVKTLIGP